MRSALDMFSNAFRTVATMVVSVFGDTLSVLSRSGTSVALLGELSTSMTHSTMHGGRWTTADSRFDSRRTISVPSSASSIGT
eukprot:4820355-Prymnesium_polylepis.1